MLSSAKLGFWEWAFLLCATVCPIGQHQLDTVVFTIWFACLVSGRKLGCFSAVQEDSQQLSTNCATATPLPREPSSTTTKNTSEPHSCFLQLCTNFTTATPLPRGPGSTTTKNISAFYNSPQTVQPSLSSQGARFYNKEHFWTTLLLSTTLVVACLCCARVNSLFLLLSIVVTCVILTNKSEPLGSHILCRHVCAYFDCRYVHASARRYVCRCFKCQPATTVKRLCKPTQETVW